MTILFRALTVFFYLCALLKQSPIYSQCSHEVTHTYGTEVINDVNVTVSSFGSVSYIPSVSCDDFPSGGYQVGNNPAWIIADGSYTFQFSPAISSLSLDFFGLDNWPQSKEQVEIYINENHYFVPAIGNPVSCNMMEMAIITNEGNIMAHPYFHHGAWKGTIIDGPIETLTVVGNILIGEPVGSLFSLNICDPLLNTNNINNKKAQVYPNPFNAQTNILFSHSLVNASAKIFNLLGQVVKEIKYFNGDDLLINRENLSEGIYLLQIVDEGKIYLNTKIIVSD